MHAHIHRTHTHTHTHTHTSLIPDNPVSTATTCNDDVTRPDTYNNFACMLKMAPGRRLHSDPSLVPRLLPSFLSKLGRSLGTRPLRPHIPLCGYQGMRYLLTYLMNSGINLGWRGRDEMFWMIRHTNRQCLADQSITFSPKGSDSG